MSLVQIPLPPQPPEGFMWKLIDAEGTWELIRDPEEENVTDNETDEA